MTRDDPTDSRFFRAMQQSTLAHDRTAGAGVAGLLGFFALFVIAALLFFAESYFLSMFIISLALLVYVTGAGVTRLFRSAILLFVSSKHLTPRAVQLQEALAALEQGLSLRPDRTGTLRAAALEPGAKLTLPDSALGRELACVLDEQADLEYAEFVAHAYYVECHEVYDSSTSHFEFVAGAMPLFGLIGTILGIIAMFDSLGSSVTVESLSPQLALALKTTLYGAVFSSVYKIVGSRFEQRIKALDYDFETLCRALAVLVEGKGQVEVAR